MAAADAMAARGLIVGERLTEAGRAFAAASGIALDAAARRPACRLCLDWSERRHHLAGQMGMGILAMAIEKRWAMRKSGRVVSFTPAGAAAFDALFAPPFTAPGNHPP